MMFLRNRVRPGYIFLVSILSVGAVTTATAATLFLLSWSAQQNGLLLSQSNQAYEYAYSCAERALADLIADLNYAGDETIAFTDGSCDILAIGGSGNADRTLCTIGYYGSVIRRMEIDIASIIPSVAIRSWSETSSFSLCP